MILCARKDKSHAETALIPSVQPVAVGAQHFEIVQVGAPVLDPSRPRPLAIGGPDLLVGFQVVQLQDADVGNPAPRTRAAKVSNDLRARPPVSFLLPPLVDGVLALRAAITGNRRLAAAMAFPVSVPPAGRVAPRRAKPRFVPPGAAVLDVERGAAQRAIPVLPFFGPIGRKARHAFVPAWRPVRAGAFSGTILPARAPGEGSAALGAIMLDRFHSNSIAQNKRKANYFDIACRRVDEAARQPDLLITPPPPQPTQEALDL